MGEDKSTSSEVASEDPVRYVLHVKSNIKGSSYQSALLYVSNNQV